ncbi:MAG: hypothetical protein ACI8PT_001802, partial [Gammaproteobacteria bacterium]
MRPSDLAVASVGLRAVGLSDLPRACWFGPVEMTLCAVTVSPGSAWVGKTHRKNKEIQK